MSSGLAYKKGDGLSCFKRESVGEGWKSVFIHEHVRERESETQRVCAPHTQN